MDKVRAVVFSIIALATGVMVLWQVSTGVLPSLISVYLLVVSTVGFCIARIADAWEVRLW